MTLDPRLASIMFAVNEDWRELEAVQQEDKVVIRLKAPLDAFNGQNGRRQQARLTGYPSQVPGHA